MFTATQQVISIGVFGFQRVLLLVRYSSRPSLQQLWLLDWSTSMTVITRLSSPTGRISMKPPASPRMIGHTQGGRLPRWLMLCQSALSVAREGCSMIRRQGRWLRSGWTITPAPDIGDVVLRQQCI